MTHEPTDKQMEDLNIAARLFGRSEAFYAAEVLTPEMTRYPVGECYAGSALNVIKLRGKMDVEYYEGVALTLQKQWVFHGWIVDEKSGVVYDPTWWALANGVETQFPAIYIGRRLPAEQAVKFMKKYEVSGVLIHMFSHSKEIQELFGKTIFD